MSNLVVRVLFAVVAAPVFLALAWHGETTRFALLCVLCATGAWEFARMVRLKWGGPSLDLFAPVATLVFLTILRSPFPLDYLWQALVLVGLVVIAFARVETDEIFPWLARHGFGIWFFGCWTAPALWSLFGPEPGWTGAGPFLFVSVAMWVADSGAYFAGRLFGRHKLCPGISPKKTVEGAVGGVLLTLVYAVATAPHWMPQLRDPAAVLAVGLVLALASIVGDLLESAVKRSCGVKDSSRLFPGHGGLYDRFDSLFFAAPVAVSLLELLFWGGLGTSIF